MSEQVTYNGDASRKERFLVEMEKHQQADALLQMCTGVDNNGTFKGCGVACAVHSISLLNKTFMEDYWAENEQEPGSYYEHDAVAKFLCIPSRVVYAYEWIFEELPAEEAKTWPLQFAAALPIGVPFPEWLEDYCGEQLDALGVRCGAATEEWARNFRAGLLEYLRTL